MAISKPEKKKILILAKGSDMGGIEKALVQFLRPLLKDGHDVSLWLCNLPGVMFEKIPAGVRILSPGKYPDAKEEVTLWNSPHYLLFKLVELTGWHSLYPSISDEEYDIAFAFGHNSPLPYLTIDKVRARKKILYFMHGQYRPKAGGREKDERYFAEFDDIVTDSSANADMLRMEFPQLAGKIGVLHHFYDVDEIRREAEECEVYPESIKEIPIICTVGRFSEEKGQLNALKAAEILDRDGLDFRWYFVGTGREYFEECRQFINEHGLKGKCILEGLKENAHAYMKGCDVYVQPSLFEAAGLAIHEATILNPKVIGSDIPAFRELRDMGENITLCSRTPEGIATALRELLNSPIDSGSCHLLKEKDINSAAYEELHRLINSQ